MKKVLLLPGWMTSVRLYKNSISDFTVHIGKLNKESVSADYVIGVSLGALVVLRDIKKIRGKVILVNPPVQRKSFATWVLRWLMYVKSEGLFLKRQTFTLNPITF